MDGQHEKYKIFSKVNETACLGTSIRVKADKTIVNA